MGQVVRFTKERRKAFLKLLEQGVKVIDAAEKVGVAVTTTYTHRQQDEDFRQAWAAAKQLHEDSVLDTIEHEIDRRGIEGWEEERYYEGQLCGYVRKFSDTLLMFRAKALAPAKYGDRVTHTDGTPQRSVIVVGGTAPSTQDWVKQHGGQKKPVDA